MGDDQQYQDEDRATAKTLWLGDVQVSKQDFGFFWHFFS